MNRRELLTSSLAAAGSALIPSWPAVSREFDGHSPKALPLRVQRIAAEIAPGINVPALICNGSLTGPLLRVHTDERIEIDLTNDSGCAIRMGGPCLGQELRFAAGERRRVFLRSNCSSHTCAEISAVETTLNRLTGVAATFAQGGPTHEADQTLHLTIHHWLPSLTPAAGAGLRAGVTYQYATLGDHLLSASEPIRVREGERVQFCFFNASPAKSVTLALARHRFLVSKLDGYALTRPRAVHQITLGPGERVEALVHMDAPGRFVLGSIDRRDRSAGFGRVVEYHNYRGDPLQPDIASPSWEYGFFGSRATGTANDATVIAVEFNPAYAAGIVSHRLHLSAGSRYRLSLLNVTGERHCVAVRGQPFLLTNVAGIGVTGILKDIVALPTFARTEIEFVASESEVDLLHADSVMVTSGFPVSRPRV